MVVALKMKIQEKAGKTQIDGERETSSCCNWQSTDAEATLFLTFNDCCDERNDMMTGIMQDTE